MVFLSMLVTNYTRAVYNLSQLIRTSTDTDQLLINIGVQDLDWIIDIDCYTNEETYHR